MSQETPFTIHLEQAQDYQFKVQFDWDKAPDLLLDSGEPLGQSEGPDAERLIAAAIGYCLSASLFFCMRNKFRQQPGKLSAMVTGLFTRNERGRLRLGEFVVQIRLSDTQERIAQLDRCARQFEDFCIVTESIRQGIPVRVQVVDATGRLIHES